MITPKKFIRMARNWQKTNAMGRKRVSSPRTIEGVDLDSGSTSFVTARGHFVIYTTDWKRFSMPLKYLCNDIFQGLFKASEEEFGASGEGPIVLPCDSVFMECILSFIQKGVGKDFEQALIDTITSSGCELSAPSESEHSYRHQLFVCGY